jgi:LysR family transcriptional activator of nhaA
LGVKLFDRVGRNLVLSPSGQEAYRYADKIFSLGRELKDRFTGDFADRPPRLIVGIADAVPKLVSRRMLAPALRMPLPAPIVVHEGAPERLLAELALHELDLVLSDSPVPSTVMVRAFNHLLGECGVTLCAAAKLAAAYRRGFPRSLDGAPFLLPLANASLRRSLDQWFEATGVRPLVRGEFADSALIKDFGQAGHGIFAVPSAIEHDVARQYAARVIGRVPSIRERFYLISTDKKLRHPAVAAIAEMARHELFG